MVKALVAASLSQQEYHSIKTKVEQAAFERASTIENGISDKVLALKRMAARLSFGQESGWEEDANRYVNHLGIDSLAIISDTGGLTQAYPSSDTDKWRNLYKNKKNLQINLSGVSQEQEYISDIVDVDEEQSFVIFTRIFGTNSEPRVLAAIFNTKLTLDDILNREEPEILYPVELLSDNRTFYIQSQANTRFRNKMSVDHKFMFLPDLWHLRAWPSPKVVAKNKSATTWIIPLFMLSLFVLFSLLLKSLRRQELLNKDLRESSNKYQSLWKASEQSNKELRQSNADLDDFAHAASHDLKSPLRAIDSLALWILQDYGTKIPEEARNDLEQLIQRTKRMNELLTGILKYSLVGRETYEPEEIDLQKFVYDISETIDKPKSFKVEASMLPKIKARKAPLQMVLQNLMSNAVKHHHREDGAVKIFCMEKTQHYEIRVTDDGPGIPEEFHERIFGMFKTLKRRDELEASGIGLALSKKAVVREGGKIRVIESDKSSGTTFSFTWPKVC